MYVIAQIAALGIITYFFTGFQVKGDVLTYLGIALVIAFINFFVRPMIKFLTLPVNLVTFGLFNLVLAFAFLYILSIFFPVSFIDGVFRSISIGNILVLNSFPLTAIATMIGCAISITFLSALIDQLIHKN